MAPVAEQTAHPTASDGSFLLEEPIPTEGLRLFVTASAKKGSSPQTSLEVRSPRPQKVVQESYERRGFHGVLERGTREKQVPDAPAYASCHDFRLLIDAESQALGSPVHSADQQEERIRIDVAMAVLEKATDAKRVTGSVCGTRFLLSEGAGKALDLFLLRVREEQALRAGPESAEKPPQATPAVGAPQAPSPAAVPDGGSAEPVAPTTPAAPQS